MIHFDRRISWEDSVLCMEPWHETGASWKKDFVPKNWTTTRLMASAKWRWTTAFLGWKVLNEECKRKTKLGPSWTRSQCKAWFRIIFTCFMSLLVASIERTEKAWQWHLMSATCTNDTVFWGKAFSSAQWIGLTSSQHYEALDEAKAKLCGRIPCMSCNKSLYYLDEFCLCSPDLVVCPQDQANMCLKSWSWLSPMSINVPRFQVLSGLPHWEHRIHQPWTKQGTQLCSELGLSIWQ